MRPCYLGRMTKYTQGARKRPQTAGAARKAPKSTRTIEGMGDYKTTLKGITSKMDSLMKRLPKGTAAKAGGFLGGPLGAKLGAGLSAITGYGDYSVSENSIEKVSTSVDMVPQFSRSDHSVRVAHREFIRDIKVPEDPTNFNNTTEVINPANSSLFPWLAKMSLLYTQYKIHGMVFTYKSMSTNFSTGGPLGTVVMATNYNVNDKQFENKIQMENSEFSVSCNPSQSLIHAIECDPRFSGLQTLYVRDPASSTQVDSDARFFDFGRYQFATTGLPGVVGTVMGELWVSYDIEFMKPVIGTPLEGYSIISHPDGTTSVNTQARSAILYMTDTYVPVINSSIKLNPSETANNVGDLNLLRSPTNPTGNFDFVRTAAAAKDRIRFYKSGVYKVVVNVKADTTGSGYRLGNDGGLAIINYPVITSSGTATASFTREVYPSTLPYQIANYLKPDGYNYQNTFEVLVDVPAAQFPGYVDVELPNGYTTGSTLIGLVTRQTSVSWIAYGVNTQAGQFLPAPDNVY
jgi:hypothetical protein